MRAEIDAVQSENDKFDERLDKGGVDSANARAGGPERPVAPPPPPTRPPPPPPIDTPPLPVVQLGPPGAVEEDGAGARRTGAATDDGEPGQILSFTNANIGSALASHPTSRASSADAEGKQAYDAALALVTSKRYPEAIDALGRFLARWPDHPNAEDAMYQRGQCYFAQGNFANAAQEFKGLIVRFPTRNRAPDALLKLALSEQRLDNAALAREHFDRLRRDFPRSDAARRIPAGLPAAAPAPTPTAPGEP